MSEYPLQLKSYFFTHQEVVANPDHIEDPESKHQFDYRFQTHINKIDDDEYGVQLAVSLDRESNDNPAYFFTLSVFAIVQIQAKLDESQADVLIKASCVPVLIGVIRERLSEMTSRGPWEVKVMDFVPLGGQE